MTVPTPPDLDQLRQERARIAAALTYPGFASFAAEHWCQYLLQQHRLRLATLDAEIARLEAVGSAAVSETIF